MSSSAPSAEKIYELLQTFHTTMLVTHSGSDSMHARPMEIAQVDKQCGVWFYTAGNSPKIQEIRQDQQVLLTFQKDHQKYLSMTGTARLVKDREIIRELWQEPFRVWFPGGVEDPDLMLVQVVPAHAEYWDNSGTQGIRYLYEAAKAYLTGTTPEVEDGEQHGRVALQGRG